MKSQGMLKCVSIVCNSVCFVKNHYESLFFYDCESNCTVILIFSGGLCGKKLFCK